MTRNDFARLSREYNGRYKDEILKMSKKAIMGHCMDIVMSEEISAVADMFSGRDPDADYYPLKRVCLNSVVRSMKKEKYTYAVFLNCIPVLCEPDDGGNYGLFDRVKKYDKLALALMQALEWEFGDDGKLQASKQKVEVKRVKQLDF